MNASRKGGFPEWAVALALLFLPAGVPAATFTVTSASDSGANTLRAAITNANASPGLDVIAFAITTNTIGVKNITLSSALPVITDPVVIDGTTQRGYSNSPLVQITGNFLAGVDGLVLAGGSNTVRGIAVVYAGTSSSEAARASGILITNFGGNTVAGCFLGFSADLFQRQNSADGIRIDNSPNNVIGGTNTADRNVISGNSRNGVQIRARWTGIPAAFP